MIAKLLVGTLGLLVVGAGGYVYWEKQNVMEGLEQSSEVRSQPRGCCSHTSKGSMRVSQTVDAEALGIMPREVSGE